MNSASNVGSLLGVGIVIYLLFVIGIAVVSFLIYYLIMKAAVRNGVTEAFRRMGISGALPVAQSTQGYPPAQTYGAPPSPAYERQNPPAGGQ